MAQSFARLGAEVHLIEAEHGVLPREDREAAELVEQSMITDGVRLHCHGRELSVSSGDSIRLSVDSDGNHVDQYVDQLLIAVGRTPNVEHLGLERLGIEYDTKGVKVDNHLRTSNPRVYAAGDICSPLKFTHAADFMARIVIQNALFRGRARASRLTIPWCTYTSPEIARVGLSERQASEQGVELDAFTQPLSEVDRAVLEGEDKGFVKIHVKKGTDRIIGATIVAEHAGDMIAEVTLAMTNNIGLGKIARTIHPYPTQADAIRKIGDQYNRTRLTPLVQSLFSKWLQWTK